MQPLEDVQHSLFAPDQVNARRNHRLIAWFYSLILTMLIVAAFHACVYCHFINFDDHDYLSRNPHVRTGLRWNNVVWAFTHAYACNYHPLTWLSHMADISMFGMRPGYHHAHQVFLHLLTSLLFYWFLLRCFERPWVAGCGAVMWAIHPQRVEAVMWVAERKSMLSNLAWCACLVLAIESSKRLAQRTWLGETRPRLISLLTRYGALILVFVLGLLSKQSVVTLPCVLLLIDAWQVTQAGSTLGVFRWGKLIQAIQQRVLLYLPLFALSVLASVVILQAQTAAQSSLAQLPMHLRLANATVAIGEYLRQMIWPTGLAIFYPHPGESVSWSVAVINGGLIMFVILAGCWHWRRYPWLLTGWLWFLGTLKPMLGFVQVGAQARADRYTDLPAMGIVIIVCGVLTLFDPQRWAKKIVQLALVLVCMAMLIRTQQQVNTWQNSVTVFEHALTITGPNPLALNNLGNALVLEKKWDRAEAVLRKAVEMDPTWSAAWYNLGNIARERHDMQQAVTCFEKAAQHSPWMTEYRTNYGLALAHVGRSEDAINQLKLVTSQLPHSVDAYLNLAFAARTFHRDETADEAYRKATELAGGLASRPGIEMTITHLHFLQSRGRMSEAGRTYSAALVACQQMGFQDLHSRLLQLGR